MSRSRFNANRVANAGFLLVVWPWILWACLRLIGTRRLQLNQAAEKMAAVRMFPFAFLKQPERLRACVFVVRRWLPPYQMGPCLKSSLLLLDLCGRAGIEVTFHLGVLSENGQRAFHAWLESEDMTPERVPSGYQELWSWGPA